MRSRGCGCFGLLFAIIAIIVMAGIVLYNTQIAPYLNNMGLGEFFDIYSSISEAVDEEALVTNAPDENDYSDARAELEDAGINIFDEDGDIDPELLNEEFSLTESITLEDTELTALINELIDSSASVENNPLSNFDEIGEVDVLEINIDVLISGDIGLSSIVKINIESLKEELGPLGIFFPNQLYLESTNTLELIDGEYALIESNIGISNLSEEQNNQLIEIIFDFIDDENSELTAETFDDVIGEALIDGIEQINGEGIAYIIFGQGTVTFSPQA